MPKKKIGKTGQKRVSKKISHLIKHEDIPQKQAVAMAMNMEREQRLTSEGEYKPKKKAKKK